MEENRNKRQRWKVSAVEKESSETTYTFLSRLESKLNELERAGWEIRYQFESRTTSGEILLAVVSTTRQPIEHKTQYFEPGPAEKKRAFDENLRKAIESGLVEELEKISGPSGSNKP